jgi:hypothetical protein
MSGRLFVEAESMSAREAWFHLETSLGNGKTEMTSVQNLKEDDQRNLLIRLKRIEGQMRGIRRWSRRAAIAWAFWTR